MAVPDISDRDANSFNFLLLGCVYYIAMSLGLPTRRGFASGPVRTSAKRGAFPTGTIAAFGKKLIRIAATAARIPNPIGVAS
jgi:hypothetical protein